MSLASESIAVTVAIVACAQPVGGVDVAWYGASESRSFRRGLGWDKVVVSAASAAVHIQDTMSFKEC